MVYLDLISAIIYSTILLIPVYVRPDLEKLKDKSLLVISISFAVPFIYHLLRLLTSFKPSSTVLAIHVIFWTMFLTSTLSIIYDKKIFFYTLFSVPLSSIIIFALLGNLIFPFTAIISLIVLAEALIYIAINGNDISKFIGSTGLITSLTLIYFFYPIAHDILIENIVYIVGIFFIPLTLSVLHLFTKQKLSLIYEPKLKHIFYVLFTFLIIMVSGLFADLMNPVYVFAGILSIILIYSIQSSYSSLDTLLEFLSSAFIVTSCSWIFITLFELSLHERIVIFQFNLNFLEVTILIMINIIGTIIIKKSMGK